jgi:hypothetical protein
MTDLTFCGKKLGNRQSLGINFLQFYRLYLQRLIDAEVTAQLPIAIKRRHGKQYPQNQRFPRAPGMAQKPAKVHPALSCLRIDFLIGIVKPRPILKFSGRNNLKKKAHTGIRFLTYKNNQIPIKSQG